MTSPGPRPRVLLQGIASARPDGLERALSRAGYRVADTTAPDCAPAAVLITLPEAGEPLAILLRDLAHDGAGFAPTIAVLRTADRDAVGRALAFGADDAMAEPVHLSEVLARVRARVGAPRHAGGGGGPGADPLLDELTGCATFEVLDRRLQDEFDRARRYALSFSLVLLDVDRLRAVNARLGLEQGDRLLGEAGAMLRRELRSPDLVVRYGGDEFALLLPETGAGGARESVLRVRRLFAERVTAALPHESRPCLSAGIVAFPHPAALQPGDLLALLEAALARAKGQSGERIAVVE